MRLRLNNILLLEHNKGYKRPKNTDTVLEILLTCPRNLSLLSSVALRILSRCPRKFLCLIVGTIRVRIAWWGDTRRRQSCSNYNSFAPFEEPFAWSFYGTFQIIVSSPYEPTSIPRRLMCMLIRLIVRTESWGTITASEWTACIFFLYHRKNC